MLSRFGRVEVHVEFSALPGRDDRGGRMGADEGGPAETHVELAGCAWACVDCGVGNVLDNDDDDVGIDAVDLAVDLALRI